MTGIRAAIGLAVLGVVIAACAAAASPATPVATARVELPPSYRFAPADITVSAGTTVSWSNADNFTHSVQFLDGGLSSEPLLMAPGEGATFTFDGPGTFAYQCHLHPQDMRGSVTVTP